MCAMCGWNASFALFEAGVSITFGEEGMLKDPKAAPIVVKFMIATRLL